MLMLLYLHQIALLLKVFNDDLARLIAVKPRVFAAKLVYLAVVVQNADDLKVVTHTDLKVVGVVRRSHFNAACAKLHVAVFIADNGDFLIDQRQNTLFANDGLIALVVGVNGNSGIAEHGFRAGGRNNNVAASIDQRITNVPEIAGLVLIFNLGVGQRRGAVRTPIDDAASLIYQALFIERDKNLAYRLRAALIHCQARSVPIAGSAELFLLLDDAVAIFVLPVPNAVKKLFTSQIEAGKPLIAQSLLNLYLSCNARMVGAGKPKRGKALHTLVANEDILHCAVHRMPHMELTCYVRGRHYYGEGLLLRVAHALERAALFPHFINAAFNLFRLIDL